MDCPQSRPLGERIPKPRHLIADRAYNDVRNERFALPVWRLGYTTIYDLHPRQRGTHPGPDGSGTQWIDGTSYPMSLPRGLVVIVPIDHDMTEDLRERIERRHQARQAYAFVPHEARHPDGSRRYRGPAVPPVRVRCSNNPISMRAPHSVPTTSCKRGSPCSCGRTVTFVGLGLPGSADAHCAATASGSVCAKIVLIAAITGDKWHLDEVFIRNNGNPALLVARGRPARQPARCADSVAPKRQCRQTILP